jgi:cytochrome c biogenesis protein CcmG/thiol:disulfide interchange protein DsbE
MKNSLRFLPLALLALLCLALAVATLRDRTPKAVQFETTPYAVLPFELPDMYDSARQLSPQSWAGRVAVVNVFASWCVPCVQEHPVLMRLSQQNNVALFGIGWRDSPEKLKHYLAQHGNPFEQVGVDQQGASTIALGISGVPETLVLDKQGRIRYRYPSALDDARLASEIIPLVERLRHE